MKVVALEKVSFSDRQNPKPVFNTLPVNDQHYLLNRDNLLQPIRTQLCQKQINFSEFFFLFLKSRLNFKPLTKKHDPRS